MYEKSTGLFSFYLLHHFIQTHSNLRVESLIFSMIYFIMTANIENVVKSQSLLLIPHTIKHRIVGIFEVQLPMIQGSKI